jgi:copper resistance protein B
MTVFRRMAVCFAIVAGPLAWAQQRQDREYAPQAAPVHQHVEGTASDAPAVEPVAVLPVPVPTAADRAAAVAPAGGHPTHESALQGLLLIDQAESWHEDSRLAFGWQAEGWVGTDMTRLWLRTEGHRSGGQSRDATLELLAGRSVSRWWDVVAGIRHDFGMPVKRDYAALGIRGLAPYWFEIAATAYLGERTQSAARLEMEHDLLITNRLVLQSHLQVDLFGKDDAVNSLAAGFATMEAGLRMRYEFTRRFAPYAGIGFERALADTAGMRRNLGQSASETRLVLGVRTWF